MTKQDAIRRGMIDGIDDVHNVYAEQGAAVVLATLKPGHVAWDEGARNAGAHVHARVPDAFVDAYYKAYASAARACAEAIRDEESAPEED